LEKTFKIIEPNRKPNTAQSYASDCKVTQNFWSASCKCIKEYPSASVQMYSFTCPPLQ